MLESEVKKLVYQSGESTFWDGDEKSSFVGMVTVVRKDKAAEVKIRNLIKNSIYTVVIFGYSQWGARFNGSFTQDVKINSKSPIF